MGTNLITSKDAPSFGGVYKMAAIYDEAMGGFVPKIKRSDNPEKVTNPGNKLIHRVYDKGTGKMVGDLIALADETFDPADDLVLFDPTYTWKKTRLAGGSYVMKELLVPVFRKGICVYSSPSVTEIAQYCKNDLNTLWAETRRLTNPHKVYVDLSEKLYRLKNQLLGGI